MRAAKVITAAFLCLGLAVPSAHGLVLCVDDDGGLAVEAAVDGACAGARPRTDDRSADSARPGLQANSASCCGGCIDVALGSGETVPPISSDSSQRLIKFFGGAAVAIATQSPSDGALSAGRTECVAPSVTAHGPPLCGTEVLRL